jgi:hypothetical protein
VPGAARYCRRGHDTAVVGRDASRTCRACRREDMAARRRADEAVQMAEQEGARKREEQRQEREWARWRASLKGPELLNQLEVEAQRDLRCPWEMSLDPPRVCGKKVRGPEAGVSKFYCRYHDRLVDEANEAHKRGEVDSAEEFYRSKGAIP